MFNPAICSHKRIKRAFFNLTTSGQSAFDWTRKDIVIRLMGSSGTLPNNLLMSNVIDSLNIIDGA